MSSDILKAPDYPIAPKLPTLEEKRKRDRVVLEKFDIYKRAEADHKGGGQYIVREIKEYIDGKGDPDTREQFYPGWTREDFKELLKMIETLGN